jgi:hypothetical protein
LINALKGNFEAGMLLQEQMPSGQQKFLCKRNFSIPALKEYKESKLIKLIK